LIELQVRPPESALGVNSTEDFGKPHWEDSD